MPQEFTDDDIKESLATWRADPSPANGNLLLTKMGPSIDYGVRRYGGAASGPALRTRAKILTFEAAKKYDPRMGVPFKPYLLQHLQGLQRFAGTETAVIRTPERVRLESDRINKATERLADELGRDPSDAELGDYMFMSPQRIARIRSSVTGTVPESAIDGGDTKTDNDIWRKFVYHSAPPHLQNIMEHTWGLHGKPILSTAELAKRRGVSAAAISQQKTRIQAMLDEVNAN